MSTRRSAAGAAVVCEAGAEAADDDGHGPEPCAAWGDARLVEACRAGDDRAWAVLLDRYRPLILAVPRRYGASPQDAADVFQVVCLELFRALPRLRSAECLRSWLATVAAHEAARWKKQRRRLVALESDGNVQAPQCRVSLPLRTLEQDEVARGVRVAIAQLTSRQQELVMLLFLQDPPATHGVVAARLGLTTASVGVARDRCLRKMRRLLAGTGIGDDVPGT